MFLAPCPVSSGSSTSAAAARWHATAAPSASSGTGLPTRSSVASASECWPSSRSPSDDLPSPSPGRGQEGGGTREGRVNRVRLAGWERGTKNTSAADYETQKTGGQCWRRSMDQGEDGGGGRSVPQKRHPPLPRTVQISIACFLHVDDGNVFVVVFIFLFYYYCFVSFSLEGETLELYLLLWFRT